MCNHFKIVVVVQMKDLRINPDGIPIKVNWQTMKVGASVFIPCLNTSKAKRQANSIAKKLGMQFRTQVRIENNNYGLRIWRVV